MCVLRICVSVCMLVCVSECLCVSVPLCLGTFLSVCMSVCLWSVGGRAVWVCVCLWQGVWDLHLGIRPETVKHPEVSWRFSA